MSSLYRMEAELERERQARRGLEEYVEALKAVPRRLGRILSLDSETREVLVYTEGQTVCVTTDRTDLEIGACVALRSTSTAMLLEPGPARFLTRGIEAQVLEVYDDGQCLVEPQGMGPTCVWTTGIPLKAGDRVTIDGPAVTGILPPRQAPAATHYDAVTWDSIGGLEDTKAALRDAIEAPLLHSKLYAEYGRTPPKGILLYGPPGCGKTMLAKAAATAVAAHHGDKGGGGFIYLAGPSVLSKWVGDSEAALRSVFAQAREWYAKAGYPAVLFIDEAEALLRARGHYHGLDSVVNTFLAESDGLHDPKAAPIVLLATNRPDTLDPAVTRDGRIDRKIRVTRPDKSSVQAIAQTHLRGKPTQDKDLASLLAEAVFDDALEVARYPQVGPLYLRHFVSGAMVATIVAHAAEKAMHRDVQANHRKAKGLVAQDILETVTAACLQQRDLDHSTVVAEILEDKTP